MLISDLKEKYQPYFYGRSILITGGTGSFGRQMTAVLVPMRPRKIVIYSRDEKKQFDMRNALYGEKSVEFFLGDIRDRDRLNEAMRLGIDVVMQAAALKQVPFCEEHPMEAVKTNVLGAMNVREAAIRHGVKTVLSISTDKAVKSVNVMGMTKAIQERIMLAESHAKAGPKFICVRYGNVFGSRGSVVPEFKRRLAAKEPLQITHKDMTRFMMTLQQAVELVLQATVNGTEGSLWVAKTPACRITDLAEVMREVLSPDAEIEETGIRPGEKIHEVLVSEEEMRRAEELKNYFILHPWGEDGIGQEGEYGSNTAHIMSKEEIKTMLMEEGWIK